MDQEKAKLQPVRVIKRAYSADSTLRSSSSKSLGLESITKLEKRSHDEFFDCESDYLESNDSKIKSFVSKRTKSISTQIEEDDCEIKLLIAKRAELTFIPVEEEIRPQASLGFASQEEQWGFVDMKSVLEDLKQPSLDPQKRNSASTSFDASSLKSAQNKSKTQSLS